MRRVVTALALVAVATGAEAAGRLLQVGPARDYQRPSEALAAARDGDVIEIDGGVYDNDPFCLHGIASLTIRGVGGGRAHIRASPEGGARHPLQCNSGNSRLSTSDGRATWGFDKVRDIVLENLEFSGATSRSGNAAGIRILRAEGGFTLRNVYLHDNQNGLITSDSKDLHLTVENSELDLNGREDGGGKEHNIYVGTIGRFTLRDSVSRRSRGGQLVKSRALVNHIVGNRLTDEAPANSNYQLEFDGGGTAYVIGNVLRKRHGSTNCCALLHINASRGREHRIHIVNNTMVYDAEPGRPGRRFVRVLNPHALPVAVLFANNLLVGERGVRIVYTPHRGVDVALAANLRLPLTTAAFVDMAGGDFRLVPGAPAIDAGIDPGSADGVPLGRAHAGAAIDIGAFEFGG